MEALRRHYGHFHRVLIRLLNTLVEQERAYWLGDQQGHIPRPDGQANTYRKALYVVEDLEPYRKDLTELEGLQQLVLGLTLAKPVGVLMPQAVEQVRDVVLSRTTSWSSHAYDKARIISKLSALSALAQTNLRAYQTYASTHDPNREALENEITTLEAGINLLRAHPEKTLRERAKSEKHTARLYAVGEEAEPTMVYVRDVGLIVAGPGLTHAGRVRDGRDHLRRKDRMEGKLEPLLAYGNYEIYSEQEWQQAKGQ